jgi:hypothetical protein
MGHGEQNERLDDARDLFEGDLWAREVFEDLGGDHEGESGVDRQSVGIASDERSGGLTASPDERGCAKVEAVKTSLRPALL